MPKNFVNLDALIVREDLHSRSDQSVSPSSKSKGIKVTDLTESSFLYQSLRKPDFQRETANWEPEKVVDLVESFLKGDFVPSIILWYSEDGKTFVIDGAHRLSALIAWIHDDYGDQGISRLFFSNFIPEGQQKVADKTRTLMASRVGSYEEIKLALANPTRSTQQQKRYARNAGTLDLHIQWVEGDPDTAEASFIKINQKATLIDPIEFQMIESRKKPNAIAARALIRAGVGHKYWGKLPKEAKEAVENLAKEIYDMLFIPPLQSPIKTLDLPVAGKGYSAESVKLLFDFVNLANDTLASQSKLKPLADDGDGVATIKYLKRIHQIISRICSNDASSLGLHPAVYFYSAVGRYQPTAFLATVSLIMELEKNHTFDWFIERRNKFEEFLVSHRYFVNQIVNQFGSGIKGQSWVFKLYKAILGSLETGSDDDLIKTLIANNEWRLKEDTKQGSKMSTEAKSAVFLKDLDSAKRCSICHARMHRNSMGTDHIKRAQDGGVGHSDNGQLAHHYCNTGYKEKQARHQGGLEQPKA
jgi:hypothetical protein